VVVVVGLTGWVPPLACRVYVLPSVPVTITWVAFVAVTVKMEELPETIEAGLVEMLTIGAGFEIPVKLTPHPITSKANGRPDNNAAQNRVRQKEGEKCTFIKVRSFVYL
jgi:hypothetical protein